MKIAVVLEFKLKVGGGFQQELSTACLLNRYQDDDRQFIFYTTEKENVEILKKLGVRSKYLNVRSINDKIYYHFLKYVKIGHLFRTAVAAEAPFEKVFIQDNIDLIYFLAPSSLALAVTKTNYMITVWDLCHRDHPEFPEVNFNGQFESRENLFNNVLPKAVAVLTDSEYGKANILSRYACDSERVYTVKFLPSEGIKTGSSTDIRKKYSLKNKYIFYPAQFWAHKNHVYIVDGLKILRDKFGLEIDAVFSGSDEGNAKFVIGYAKKSGLEGNVHHVGFIPNEEMASFYKQAVALVMPTYFGPTNIPPLEAFTLGCPVCYPDLPGLRDQVQDAAFLMDLNEPESMARHIATILSDREAVMAKVTRGKQLLSEWTEDDHWKVLNQIFDKYARKMRCWKI